MLPGLVWLTPLVRKSGWPQTRVADLEPCGRKIARLLPASATNRLPAPSALTSLTPNSTDSEASGKTLTSGSTDTGVGWPRAIFAEEAEAEESNTRMRWFNGTATYNRPSGPIDK